MPDTTIAFGDLRDPVGKRFWPASRGRDPARTPMAWEPTPGAGFTKPGVRPWLPLGDHQARNVARQRQDFGSLLHLCRDLIALRRDDPDLRRGSSAPLPASPGILAWRRGARFVAVLNLYDSHRSLEGVDGTIRIATDRCRDGERVRRVLDLKPWEGALIETRADLSSAGGGVEK
jgi:alpha-glucosidase